MTPRDFCYWLQGYFEISDSRYFKNDRQVLCLRKHLEMCIKYMEMNQEARDQNPRAAEFVSTTNQVLSYTNWERDSINALLDKVSTRLNSVFKHEIDMSMGDDGVQHELNIIHNTSGYPDPYSNIDLDKDPYPYDDTLMRC